jgi:hypothetical protein
MVLSQTVSCSCQIHQLDVKNAFLHDTLLEIVYCSQPARFVDPTQPDHVCLLNKSLHELKQVPQAWYNWFTTYLTSLLFVEAMSHTSLFIFQRGIDMVYLLVYVDDIVLTASSTGLLQHTISALKQEFAMRDLGPLHHLLGLFVQHHQMGSSSLSAIMLLISLSMLEWWTASQFRCSWTHMPMSLSSLGLLLLI